MKGKEEKRENEKNRGIILVALVVTLIVLILLAGMSLNLVIGNNGIIEKAKKDYIIASIKEKLELMEASVLR